MADEDAKDASGGVVADRRSALKLAGGLLAAGAGGAAAVGAGAGTAQAATPRTGAAAGTPQSPMLLTRPEALGAPAVEGLHLTFGRDPAREMTASWSTDGPVRRPRVRFGTAEGGFGRTVAAETVTYKDGASGRTVHLHHARMTGLSPDTYHTYAALHDGGRPDAGSFRTAPSGRRPFTFTSFGDQSVPDTTWKSNGSGGWSAAGTTLGSPASGDIVAGIEQVDPLFHLLNGDLCYANLDADRLRTWQAFHANNSRSARFRPWMPAAGNHENERGNGPIGFAGYQARFALPGQGHPLARHGGGSADAELAGLWYSFTVGPVHVIVLQNDDVALQDGGDEYIHGYSGGAQRAWLERDLRAARADRSIDWVVVCMHQVVISSADFNGADLGVRREWGPLFDRYGVDLVVCGHEHHYERSLPVRGVVSGSETLTPEPVSTATDVMDTGKGTVHMVIGGGGTNAPSNQTLFTPAKAKVITSVGAVGANGRRPSVFTYEEAPWVGVRDADHSYGFAAFTLDPGARPGDTTRLHVTYYTVGQPDGAISPLESFVLQRRRSDG